MKYAYSHSLDRSNSTIQNFSRMRTIVECKVCNYAHSGSLPPVPPRGFAAQFPWNQHANFLITVAYQQQTFITTDQSAFQRAGATGQYTITGQPSPLPPVAPQTVPSTAQRPLNGQFMDPAATATQSVGYERQDYVNGYQQQVQLEMNRF